MGRELARLQKEVVRLTAENALFMQKVQSLSVENMLLKQKIHSLIMRLFGKKSEKLDPKQLLLELGELLEVVPEPVDDDPPPKPPKPRGKHTRAKERLPDDLPVERSVIDPPEVVANPDAYVCIGEEESVELDVEPMRFVKRVTVRRKFVLRDRSQAPVIAPALPSLITGSIASPSLLTHIVISKYIDHLPLYRQQKIFHRHGIEISRKSMCSWIWKVGHWLTTIYDEMKKEAWANGYLQIDETPIRYLDPGFGKTRQGYLWAYHAPGQAIVFDWRTGRGSDSLKAMLRDYQGDVQCDGYQVYQSYNHSRGQDRRLTMHGCWAHVRRKFFEAKDDSPFALEILTDIQGLYRIETQLRAEGATPGRRHQLRQESRPLVEQILQKVSDHRQRYLPQGHTGKAVTYLYNQSPVLSGFLDNGRIEIDNNLVENAIRPTAIGKKNWLFIGSADAGYQSAVIYSVVETCRKLAINPREYLLDVLPRLPALKAYEARQLTPSQWLAARSKQVA